MARIRHQPCVWKTVLVLKSVGRPAPCLVTSADRGPASADASKVASMSVWQLTAAMRPRPACSVPVQGHPPAAAPWSGSRWALAVGFLPACSGTGDHTLPGKPVERAIVARPRNGACHARKLRLMGREHRATNNPNATNRCRRKYTFSWPGSLSLMHSASLISAAIQFVSFKDLYIST